MISKPDRITIDYFKVEGSPGGSQEWFSDYWMRTAGCAALAACDMAICLAGNLGLSAAVSCNPRRMTREDYIRLGNEMKLYIRPRVGGVFRTSTFTGGFERYLRDRGYQAEFAVCQGSEDYAKALHFVKTALKKNLPVAYLLLRHKDQRFENLSWHWFSVTGYSRNKGRDWLTYHTYSGVYRVDFEELWDTGKLLKGGMTAIGGIGASDRKRDSARSPF